MHSFDIDIRVDKRFLETYIIHLVSKYLLRRVAILSSNDHPTGPIPMTMNIQAYGDVTRITVEGVPANLAEVFPNAVPWVVEYETRDGLTTVSKLSRWAETRAPKELQLTILDQDFIARGLDMGYAEKFHLTEHDTEYFRAFTSHILPLMEPAVRAEFDAWFSGMCVQAETNRRAQRSVIVDELPFILKQGEHVETVPGRGTFFTNPSNHAPFEAALRAMDGRIITVDFVPPGRGVLNMGPQSRQQFRNDREAPSRGKKGRVKMFANKNGAVYPKPGGTRGY